MSSSLSAAKKRKHAKEKAAKPSEGEEKVPKTDLSFKKVIQSSQVKMILVNFLLF